MNERTKNEQERLHSNLHFLEFGPRPPHFNSNFDSYGKMTVQLSLTNMFCSRIKNKNEIINRIRAFFFLTQKPDFANNTYSFSELVFYIFEMLQEIIHKEDYIVQSEQLLDALLTCFTLNESTCIPTINEQVVTKNLISCQNLKTFKDICKSLIQLDSYRSYKIKFKLQDLENNIKHY